MLLPLAIVLAPLPAKTAAQNVEAFRKATVARDYAWFEKTFAKDYEEILGNRRIPRATALATIRKGLARSPVATLQARVVKVKGSVVTAAFMGTMKGRVYGRPATVIATWRDDQTWVAQKGRWLLRSSRTYGFKREAEL